MSAPPFRFFFITNSPQLGAFMVDRGVDRLFVDLEINGKVERQGHLSTVISRHSFNDLERVRQGVPGAELMARLNPVHAGSGEEVERAIAIGADVLMLPMFRTRAEVETFTRLVAGRARICLLVETGDAARDLERIIAVPGVDEVHIGLNDLHLDLKNSFMFEPLANGVVDAMAATLRAAGMRFGIGGLARHGEGLIPAEFVLGEHYRLGSTAAILSRTFHRGHATVAEVEAEMDAAIEIGKLRAAYEAFAQADATELDALHVELGRRVAGIVQAKKAAQ